MQHKKQQEGLIVRTAMENQSEDSFLHKLIDCVKCIRIFKKKAMG